MNYTQNGDGSWVPATPLKASLGTKVLMFFDRLRKKF